MYAQADYGKTVQMPKTNESTTTTMTKEKKIDHIISRFQIDSHEQLHKRLLLFLVLETIRMTLIDIEVLLPLTSKQSTGFYFHSKIS